MADIIAWGSRVDIKAVAEDPLNFSIQVVQSDGSTPVDLTGYTLEAKVVDADGGDLATFGTAVATPSNGTIVFTLSAVNVALALDNNARWWLRETSSQTIFTGRFVTKERHDAMVTTITTGQSYIAIAQLVGAPGADGTDGQDGTDGVDGAGSLGANWSVSADQEFGAVNADISPNYLSASARAAIDTYFMDQPGGSITLEDGSEHYLLTGQGGTWAGGSGSGPLPIRVGCNADGSPDFSDVTVGSITGLPTYIWTIADDGANDDEPIFWAGIQAVYYDEDNDIAVGLVHVEDVVGGTNAHWVAYFAYSTTFTTTYDWIVPSTDKLLRHQMDEDDITSIPDGGAQTFFQHIIDGDWMVGLVRDVSTGGEVCRIGKARLSISESISYAQECIAAAPSPTPPTFEKYTAVDTWTTADGAFCLDLLPDSAPSWLGGFQIVWIEESDAYLIIYGYETAISGQWSLYGMVSYDGMDSFSDPFVIRSLGQEPWTTKTDYISIITDHLKRPLADGSPLLIVHQEAVLVDGWDADIPVSKGTLKPTVRPLTTATDDRIPEAVYVSFQYEGADWGKSGGGDITDVLGVDGFPHPCYVIIDNSDETSLYETASSTTLNESTVVDLTDSGQMFRKFRSEYHFPTSTRVVPAVQIEVGNLGSGQRLFYNTGLTEHLPVMNVDGAGFVTSLDGTVTLTAILSSEGDTVAMAAGEVWLLTTTGTTFNRYQISDTGAHTLLDNPATNQMVFGARTATLGRFNADTTITDLNVFSRTAAINARLIELGLDGLLPTGQTDGHIAVIDGDAWSIEAPAASGLSNVVEDTTPQLGGNLDGDGFNVDLYNGGTGAGRLIIADGDVVNPSIAFGSDLGLGIFKTTNAVGFARGGNEIVRYGPADVWLASAAKLQSVDGNGFHIKGSSSLSTDPVYSFRGTLGAGTGSCGMGRMSDDTASVAFFTENTRRMSIRDATGIHHEMAVHNPLVITGSILTLDKSHHTVEVTAAVTITLPTATGIAGREYVIINTSGGTVTVATTGGQTIGNSGSATSTTITTPVSLKVVSNGSAWRIIS